VVAEIQYNHYLFADLPLFLIFHCEVTADINSHPLHEIESNQNNRFFPSCN